MLEVRLLGQFQVQREGTPLVIPSRAAQSLFAYLLLTAGTPHRREQLAGLLWPDTTEDKARSNLRHELWRLRKIVEPKTRHKNAAPFLSVDEISIEFDAKSDYWLDVAQVRRDSGKPESADDLIRVLSHYRGELLPGFYEEWVVLERERIHAVYDQKMARLLELLVEGERWQETLEWGERWIAQGQTPEPAYRALMLAHRALGNVSQVAAVYERCVHALREDLGVEPSAQTRALFDQLSKTEAFAKDSRPPLATSHPQGTAAPVEKRRKTVTAPRYPSRTTNLPVPLTSFIGRKGEIEEVKRLLSRTRLLTLTGSAGVGKTRLALQAANELIKSYKDGVWWVELVALADPGLVPQVVAQALAVREVPGQPLIETLVNYLHSKRLLLALDNCEHLINACAHLGQELLSRCSSLKILATSREPFGIAGETTVRVPSLPFPESTELAQTKTLQEFASVRLFVERAAAVHPNLALTRANAVPIAEICRRLDGIPLAIELAAARVKVLSLEEIAARLDDRFNLLTQGHRTALARHQTLRATIDWSYDLLTEPEKLLFQRLAVFPGGFTLEAAEAVCGQGTERSTILDLLGRLVDKSLLIVETALPTAETYYRFLEMIREYAREKLDKAGETGRLRERHRDFYITFAEQAGPKLKSPEQFQWLDRIELEHDNLRAAWKCAMEGNQELALRLASALVDFWLVRGNPSEGREWMAQLFPQVHQWDPAKRARALAVGGQLAYSQRDLATARTLLAQALESARAAEDTKEIASALLWLGRTAHRQHDDGAAQQFTEECLAMYQALGDSWSMAMSIFQLAAVAAAQGRYADAEERYADSLARFQTQGDRLRAGYVLNGLGELARLLGDYERAGKYYEQDIRILREQRSPVALVTPLVNQGWVPLHRGDYRRAQSLFGESLTLSSEYGNKNGVAISLAGLAGALGMMGKLEESVQMFGAVESLLESIGMAGRMDPSDQKEFDHYVAVVRDQFGEAAFAELWANGRSMTMERVVAFALETIARSET